MNSVKKTTWRAQLSTDSYLKYKELHAGHMNSFVSLETSATKKFYNANTTRNGGQELLFLIRKFFWQVGAEQDGQ